MKRSFWLAAAAVVILCAGGGLFLYRSGFFEACASQEELRAYIAGFSPYSHLCFFMVQLLSVVLAPIPSNITAAAGGVLFGVWPAFFLTYGAVIAGSLLVFLLARALGQRFADRLVSRTLSEQYLQLIREKTELFLALAFLFPFFPDDVLCILAGLTELPFRRFALLVIAARPWGLLFASPVAADMGYGCDRGRWRGTFHIGHEVWGAAPGSHPGASQRPEKTLICWVSDPRSVLERRSKNIFQIPLYKRSQLCYYL